MTDTSSLYKEYADETYRIFSSRIANDPVYPLAGIRVPIVRKLAKEIQDIDFPIIYHEDVLLKALYIGSLRKPFRERIPMLDNLLPYLSSWDHSDLAASSMKIRKGDEKDAFDYFSALTHSDKTFIRRLGIIYLFSHRKLYDRDTLLDLIVSADSEEYYISMAVAWSLQGFYADDKSAEAYFGRVSEATKKKTLRKIRESRRT